VVTDQKQKGVASAEVRSGPDGIRISARFRLFDESKPARVPACCDSIRLLVSGTDHQPNRLDASSQNLFDDDREGRFGHSVAIDQRLERQGALVFAGGGDEGFADFHESAARVAKAGRSVKSRVHQRLLAR
jgi:hypothetical protein